MPKIILTSLFSFALCTGAYASSTKIDPYQKEIDRLNALEKEFQSLIREAKEVLSTHSSDLQNENPSPPVETKEAEKSIPAATADSKEPPTEPAQEVIAFEVVPPAEKLMPENSFKEAEPAAQNYTKPEPRRSFSFSEPETPWVGSYNAPANDFCTSSVQCENKCTSNSQYRPRQGYCPRDSVLLYTDFYLGNRPSFDGSIYTAGFMYFESSLYRNGITLFIDVNGSYFQHNQYGVTAGIGSRFDLPCSNTILGINAYLDYIDSDVKSFRQAGIGLEWINCSYSIRANGYFPLGGRRSSATQTVYDDYIGDYIVEVDSWINALQGYDIEFRKHICLPCDFWFYPALGAYYLTGDGCSKLGVMGGLAVSWRNMFSVEGIAYYDKCNRATGEAYLSVNIPLEYLCNPCLGAYCQDYSRIRVRRRNYIPSERVCKYTTNY